MKKVLLMLIVYNLFTLPVISVKANNFNNDENKQIYKNIEYVGNGIVEETIIEETVSMKSTRTIKSGTKTINYKHGSTILWSVSVTGTFSYNGKSSSCTNSSVKADSRNRDWKIVNKSSSKNGSTAIGKATAKKYMLGVCIQTINETVKLTCSSTGRLS